MTYQDWIQDTIKLFITAGIKSARLDALLLLEYATKHNKAYLLAHPETPLQGYSLQQGVSLQELVQRRIDGEPMAYILNKKEFYGRDFIINKNVLVPRPESEDFITLLKSILNNKNHLSEVRPLKSLTLIDVGTGSGCLAITAKLEFPELEVIGTDTSSAALIIAKKNAKSLHTNINFKEEDLLEQEKANSINIIFANLPYVPINYKVSKEVLCEPTQAVFAKQEGLELIYKLAPNAYKTLKKNGLIFIESLLDQQQTVKSFYQKNGFKFVKKAGLIQVFSKNTFNTSV